MIEQLRALLEQRRLVATARAREAAAEYMQAVYLELDPSATWPPDVAKRMAAAVSGALRELTRTHALADLGVTETHQVAGAQPFVTLVEGEWQIEIDWSGTVLADPEVLWRELRQARQDLEIERLGGRN